VGKGNFQELKAQKQKRKVAGWNKTGETLPGVKRQTGMPNTKRKRADLSTAKGDKR